MIASFCWCATADVSASSGASPPSETRTTPAVASESSSPEVAESEGADTNANAPPAAAVASETTPSNKTADLKRFGPFTLFMRK